MELNLDCMRKVLQYCVDNIQYSIINEEWDVRYATLDMLYNSDLQHTYTQTEIMYSVIKLEECHFIKIRSKFPLDRPYLEECAIEDITMSGYQFLEAVHDDTIWEKTKSIAKSVGNNAINFVESTAHDIAVESAKALIYATIAGTQNKPIS